jgi:HPt (histidine-containing phosphotransfer) domain-containing protein
MEHTAQPFVADALDKLWVQFLPQMEERVAVLVHAGELLKAGKLGIEQRSGANAAAHKLAGVLGTFGLTKGTILAREAEILYSSNPGDDPDAPARLAEIAEQLKTIVAGRK